MNLIERRRQMMMSKSLPYDAEIEYLESSGKQYIDTGIVPYPDSTGFEGTVEYVALSGGINDSDNYIFGVRQNSQHTRFWAGVANRFLRGAIGTFKSTEIVVNINTKRVMTFNLNGNAKITFGSDEFVMDTSSFTLQRNAYLFAANDQGNPSFYSSAKLYFAKIYEGTTLVRDFIPVRVGQVGYMYDKVSGQLFGNQGTGNFVLGPDNN